MVKSFISLIVSVVLLLGLIFVEQFYINNTFKEFKVIMVDIYEKIKNDRAKKEDIIKAQEFWIDKKEKLHVFIPHNDIKEIELWLAESSTLVENDKKEDAISKIDVVIELIEQIPKIYSFRIENLL